MKRTLPKQIGDKITGRANAKGVTIQNRHYVIGTLCIIQVDFLNLLLKILLHHLLLPIEIHIQLSGDQKI